MEVSWFYHNQKYFSVQIRLYVFIGNDYCINSSVLLLSAHRNALIIWIVGLLYLWAQSFADFMLSAIEIICHLSVSCVHVCHSPTRIQQMYQNMNRKFKPKDKGKGTHTRVWNSEVRTRIVAKRKGIWR